MFKVVNLFRGTFVPSSFRLRRKRPRSVRAVLESLEPRQLLSANVTSYHQDAANSGQDLTETLLTSSNVNATDFGRIFDTALDGQIYAQPLAVANVDITRGSNQGIHNVIYVATMHDSLFAIDSTTGQILWQDSFLQISNPQVTTVLSPSATAGVTTIPAASGDDALVNTTDVGPELGILATPVINASTNVLYVEANTQEYRNGSTPTGTFTSGTSDIHYVQRLWAISLSDGSVAISPTNPAVEPTTGGEVIGDTILDPTSGSVPSFSSYTGYKYVVGPYIKGTGNNGGGHTDGWVVNSGDTTSPWGKISSTPQADGYIAFNALQQMGRTALTLINGTVYFGYASHGDDGPYYGWLLGYNATSLANIAALVTVPTYESFSTVGGDDSSYDGQAGFWGSGTTITTDGTYIYLATGNGAFNPTTANFSSSYTSTDGKTTVQMPLDNDYGDAVIKIAIDSNATQNGTPNGSYNPDNYNPNGYGLKVVDYFVPSNVVELNDGDLDLGSGGVTIIPASGPGYSNPDGDPMLVIAGKEGRIYLLDSDNLGGYNTAYNTDGYESTAEDPSGFDRVLGEYYYYEATHSGTNANNGSYKDYDSPSYYDGDIYITLGASTPTNTVLPQWEISVASLLAAKSPPDSGVYTTIADSTSNSFGGRGPTSTISANGSGNAIVWSIDVTLSSSDALQAFNANNLSTLYSSQTDSSRDSLTNAGTIPGTTKTGSTGNKFSVPTVFNGMVYVATGAGTGTSGLVEGTLVGYGLLPSYAATSSDFLAPSNVTGYANSTTSTLISWHNNSPDATEFEIERATNGGTYSLLANVANTASATLTYTDTTVAQGNTYQYKIIGVSGGSMTLPATGAATTAETTAAGSVTVAVTPPTLVSAASSKTQGAAGTFKINLPLTGGPGIEDRSGGPTQIVLTFGASVTLGSNFTLSLSSGSGTATASGDVVAINMTGATNGQVLTATLDDVRDVSSGASGNYSIEVGVLLGDVTGDGVVNSADVTQVKLQSGQPVTSSNFRDDVNANGAINSTDITLVKLNSGDVLTLAASTRTTVQPPKLLAAPVAARGGTLAPPPPPQAGGNSRNEQAAINPRPPPPIFASFSLLPINADQELLDPDTNLLKGGN